MGPFTFRDVTLRSFGVAGVGVVLVAMAAAITLLPAVLVRFGHRIKPAKAQATTTGFFFRLSQVVQRRAVPVVIVVGIALVALATPAGLSIVDVVPNGTSQDDAAQALAMDLRRAEPGFDTQVGGPAAVLVDFKGGLLERLPIALAMIVVATFVLLFLMTGSIAVPIKAIAMDVLSLGATFGALVWVFQEGRLSGLLGFDPVGSIDTFMPVLIFIFAFGLSMDYEVFLMSRIKEAHDETGDNELSVSMGLQRSGGVITSAALLIVVVFAGFAAGEVLAIKQLGVGLALR